MHDKNGNSLTRAKSYTSIYDIFGPHPFINVLYKNPDKAYTEVSVFQATCGDSSRKISNTQKPTDNQFITSEKYHCLNKDISYNSVRSTSTIFYDLDDVIRRQSFHCLFQLEGSKPQTKKTKFESVTGFSGKNTAIVQECSTQVRQKHLINKQPRDSLEISSRKRYHRKFPNDLVLSSEIFLKDDDYQDNRKRYYDREIVDGQQKFWSYAKYRTEYTKPIPEEKKSKKKDRGKRTEDPCPCQLFSYACPCTDEEKTLTELAKNSKILTVAEQVTSTAKFSDEKRKNHQSSSNKHKHETLKESKVTSTSFETNNRDEPRTNEPAHVITHQNDKIQHVENNQSDKTSSRSRAKSSRKTRQIVCPNCKEKVEIISSTEEFDISKSTAINFTQQELTSTAAYTYSTSLKSPTTQILQDGDVSSLCTHDPRCELVPVCQMMPDETFVSPKKNVPPTKSQNPRVIRITKACRHHPPCTVVPSCQRANVLKNNCEYIPPCLHRPRCVNLPLCVPMSKTFHLDNVNQVDTVEGVDCLHVPRSKYVPMCSPDSLDNSVNHPFSIVSQVQNACEFVNKYQYLLNSEAKSLPHTRSPCQMDPPIPCGCKSTKSCQYDCLDCKCNLIKGSASDAVIFIRDVGCQFRNKSYSPKISPARSKASSASFDYIMAHDVKVGNYFANYHTLRYEDKYTNPQSMVEIYVSSRSISSTEIDSNCPSHGHRASRKDRPTGFVPQDTTPFVAAFQTYKEGTTSNSPSTTDKEICRDLERHECHKIPTKRSQSRRSFLKGKCKNTFCAKRRRKHNSSSHLINCGSKRVFRDPNAS